MITLINILKWRIQLCQLKYAASREQLEKRLGKTTRILPEDGKQKDLASVKHDAYFRAEYLQSAERFP